MYIEGNATNFSDLIDKIKLNLTENNWVNLEDKTVLSKRQLYFKNSITNKIIGFKESSSSPDYFNLILNSCESYSSSFDFFNQKKSIPSNPENSIILNAKMPVLSCINSPMPFWFFINDNRVVIVLRCNSSYNSAYLGKIEQYGSPMQYSNPIFVGGNASSYTMNNSSTSSSNECFIFEKSNKRNNCGSALKKENNNWVAFSNNSTTLSDGFGAIYPTSNLGILNNTTTDGDYLIEPIVVYSDTSAAGELENIFWIPGVSLSAEATITINAEDYIIFPNVFRTTEKDYYCIKKI